jgi:1A family penicillin-binding protein
LFYYFIMRKTGQSWASRKRGSSRVTKLIQQVAPFFKKTLKKAKKAGLVKNLILASIAAFLLGAILFLGLFAWLSRDLPDPNSLTMREVPQSTKIYDRTEEHLLYEISGDEKRTLVTLDQIPQYVIDATVTAEDRKFYDHSGIDIKGIIRAFFSNVTSLDPTGQGASTITQQLVKNAILTNEKTITRKVKEIVLAIALERRYTKEEILQLYLNEIAYGSTNYGIESAALAYFEKRAEELTLAESATLAALPKAPSTFLNDPERLLARRDWILQSMADIGYINQQEADEAKSQDTSVTLSLTDIDAPHFVLWVKEQLEQEYGERLVEQGGLKVVTSLDFDKQMIAEEAVMNNRDARSEQYGFNNSGLVAVDPSNGHILSMVGSADYFDDEIDGQVNVPLRPLQPGSSFKPIVYAAAFERGYTPNSILWDVDTTFPTATGPYAPKNYDLSQHGPMTLRAALQGSLNVPAVKLLYLIGVQNGLDFAEKLGYSTFTDRSKFGLAIVLGGAEVELLEHTSAYATFANEGVRHEPVSILRVEEPGGVVLQEWEEGDGEQVIEKNVARTITNVLSDDGARGYAFGTGGLLTLPGRVAAAKTGTTNDYKDAWTVGYTPELAAGVWTGNTDGTAMNRGSGGSSVASPIWNEFMRRALEGEGAQGFTSPSIPMTGKSILDGTIPSEVVVIDTASGKLATDRTPDRFREEKFCGEFHTILTFVDRADPLGDAPSNPEKDFNYQPWEDGVIGFLAGQKENPPEDGSAIMEVCEIPTEEDDLHVSSNTPSLRVKSPRKNDNVGRSFETEITTSAPRGISRVEYLIDGTLVLRSSSTRGATVVLPSWVGSGSHALTVISYDDIDNSKEQQVTVNVTEGGGVSTLTISNPFNNQTIEKTQEGYSVVVESSKASSFKSLTVSVQNVWTGQTTLLLETLTPSTFNAVDWVLPEAAQYLILASAQHEDGSKVDATPILVSVVEQMLDGGFSLIELDESAQEDEEPTEE